MDAILTDRRYGNSIRTKEKYESDYDGKTAKEKAKLKVEFFGPWGGSGGYAWNDESMYTGVREITIMSCQTIDSICVTYDMNGIPVSGQKHGGDGGSCNLVSLQWPDERLMAISGYCSSYSGDFVVRSLTFTTNQRKIGPFGVETGTPFSSPIIQGGQIVGFAGRSGRYLDQIAIYIST